MKSTETVSMPNVTPLFITPLEYRISRMGKADTTVRLMQNNLIDNYKFPLTGTITQIVCDPNNWIINKVLGPSRDYTLGVLPTPTAPPNTTGIEEVALQFATISIGPNPTSDYVFIKNPAGAAGKAQLLDVAGKLLDEKALNTEVNFDLKNLPVGIYMLKVSDAENTERYSQKIIRQ